MSDHVTFTFITGGAYQGKLNYALSLFHSNPVLLIDGSVVPEDWFSSSLESSSLNDMDAVRLVLAERERSNIGSDDMHIAFLEEEPDKLDMEGVTLDAIVNHAEMMVKVIRSLSMTPEKALENLLSNFKRSNQIGRLVIIADEVGSGVVPLGKEARLDREYAGKLAVACASRASQVVHVLAGIPIVIKQ